MLRMMLETCPAPGSATEPAANPMSELEFASNGTAHTRTSRQARMLVHLTEHLSLTPPQQIEAARLLRESRGRLLPLRKESRKRVAPLAADFQARVAALLTPEQKGDWNEMLAQYVDAEDCPSAPGAPR